MLPKGHKSHGVGGINMKRCVLVCAVFLVLAGLVAAPLSAAMKLGFGLKAGASFSNIAWSDDDGSEKMVVKPTFGGFVLIPLTPMLSLQPEVDYLVTGEKWTDVIEIVENYTYLHIPVLLRYRFMETGKALPFVVAGPAVGFLLKATDTGEDIKEWHKSTDFGAEVGAGVEIPAGAMKAFVEARFYLGLTNTYQFSDKFTMKNRALTVCVGLLF